MPSRLSAFSEGGGSDEEFSERSLAPAARLGLTLDSTILAHIDFGGCAWEFGTYTDMSVLTNFDNAWACGCP